MAPTRRGQGWPPAGRRPECLPERIALLAANEDWRVAFHRTAEPTRGRVHSDGPGSLVVVTSDQARWFWPARALLLDWLKLRARQILVPRLAWLAATHGFSYRRTQVRCQRTRWASCSARGTISLNARLLFLEPFLVDYVLLHELCHTVVPDHSARFWSLLGQYDPQWAEHRRLLRHSQDLVPPWAR